MGLGGNIIVEEEELVRHGDGNGGGAPMEVVQKVNIDFFCRYSRYIDVI